MSEKKKRACEARPHSAEEHRTPSTEVISDPPVDSFEMVNKYGTYNIQPTAEGAWEYPAISQGLPKQKD